jgi:surfactin synthase thioesterase subunit
MPAVVRAPSRWLPYPAAGGPVRLYCLPHAGGSASAFRPWIGRLDGATVLPVQPAGRETRLRDAPHTSMDALAAELAEVLLADAAGDPYAVYGHSLGALVGYEVVHRIEALGGPPPVHLLVSGCAAPQWPTHADPATTEGALSDERIVALLRSLGGTPEVFLADPRVLRMILPPLRADLTVKDTYRYRPRPPLAVPITAIASTDDPRAGVDSMTAWRDQTIRRARTHVLPGGHFAVLEQADTTLNWMRAALAPPRH